MDTGLLGPLSFGHDFRGETPSGGHTAGEFCDKMYPIIKATERIGSS